MSKLNVFETAVKQEVANHSIYVWGASGQLCKNVTEKWIREHEARNDHGSHADDAVDAWNEVMSGPYKDVARCFDCSGYISYCLIQCGALDKRRDCDGLYARSEPTDLLENGTLLFRANSKDPNDETHVGVYFDGFQYHAKGRKDKVCCERFNPKYWHKFAWFKNLPHEVEPSPVEPYIFMRNLKYGCTGTDVIELKKLLIMKGFGKGLTVDTKNSPNFRSTTRRRVKQFQKSVHLKTDGIAGHDTIIALGGVWLGEQ